MEKVFLFSLLQFPVIITRSNNAYGPHQYPEKVGTMVIYRFMIPHCSDNQPAPVHFQPFLFSCLILLLYQSAEVLPRHFIVSWIRTFTHADCHFLDFVSLCRWYRSSFVACSETNPGEEWTVCVNAAKHIKTCDGILVRDLACFISSCTCWVWLCMTVIWRTPAGFVLSYSIKPFQVFDCVCLFCCDCPCAAVYMVMAPRDGTSCSWLAFILSLSTSTGVFIWTDAKESLNGMVCTAGL